MKKGMAAVWAVFFCVGTATATVMGDLASQMKPGEWKMLNTANLVNAVSSADVGGGATGGVLPYTEDGAWDPVSEQFFFVGGDHNWNVISTKFISYSAKTNVWQVMTRPPWATFVGAMHGYDHNAIDVAGGRYFCRRSYADRVFEEYDIASKTWTDLPANSVYSYQYACCGGVEYFPELRGLLHVQGNDEGTHALGAYLYSDSTRQWRKLQNGLSGGNGNAFAEYNPVHHVMVFGGESSVFKLEGSGKITALKQAPLTLGVNNTIFTVDPVSGDFLVFGRDGSFYVYDVTTDTWTKQPGSRFFDPVTGGGAADGALIWEVVATPLSNYGVVMFVKFNNASSGVYLYKHSASAIIENGKLPFAQGGEIQVVPNPIHSTVMLCLPRALRPGERLAVYNLSGRLLQNLASTSSARIPWTPDRLPAGLYLLKAEMDGRHYTKKILINR